MHMQVAGLMLHGELKPDLVCTGAEAIGISSGAAVAGCGRLGTQSTLLSLAPALHRFPVCSLGRHRRFHPPGPVPAGGAHLV